MGFYIKFEIGDVIRKIMLDVMQIFSATYSWAVFHKSNGGIVKRFNTEKEARDFCKEANDSVKEGLCLQK